MATLPNPVKEVMDRPAWFAYMERRLRPKKRKKRTSQYNFGTWLSQMRQKLYKTAKMEAMIDKNDPLMDKLEVYKYANKMKTLGSFEDLLGVIEGNPVVASVKVDGTLCAIGYDGNAARLVSLNGRVRRGLPVTDEIERKLRGKGPTVFVAELYGVDEKGEELPYPQAISLLRKPKTEEDEQRIRVAVFDTLEYDGRDVSDQDYWKRLTIATNTFGNGTYVNPVYAVENGESTVRKLWDQQVLTEGHEGLVVRTDDHYKIRPVNTFDLAVVGVEKSKSHPEWAGALMLAFMDRQGNFLDAGKVGSGLTQKDREDWLKWANRHKVEERDRYIYVNPFVADCVVEIRHEGLNPVERPAWRFEAGKYEPVGKFRSTALRKPVIVRVREDKHVHPEDVRIEQFPVKASIRMARDGFAGTAPPETYYKGADAANYLITRLILERAQEEYGFLDSFFDQYGIARGYADYYNIDPKFVAYLPQAISEVIQVRGEGLKPPTGDQRRLLAEWKELWGDPLLTDEDVAAFIDQYPGEGPQTAEAQEELVEWSELLNKWSEHYQDMLYATWSTPEYKEVLSYQYSPRELARVEKDPSVEPQTIWEEYHDEVIQDDWDYLTDRLVQFYQSSPAAGLGYMHAFGTDERNQLLKDLTSYYGVSDIAELHEYTSQNLPLSEQGREFYRWYMRHQKELEDRMEAIPSLPLTLLVQDVSGGEYEVPLGKVEETQTLFVELQDELRNAFAPTVRFKGTRPSAYAEPPKAAVVYVRSESPLWDRAEDLESLVRRQEFGASPDEPAPIIFLEVPQMDEDFQVLPITLSALIGLRNEYTGNRCVCPTDGKVYTRTELSCEVQECPDHPGRYLESTGPTIFGDMQDKLKEMYEAGETLYEPADIDKALEDVEEAIVGAEPNIAVYYAETGPLAQEARVRGGLGLLEMYTGHTVFLPSTEVTESFQVVDNIPDELFARLKGATDAGHISGLPTFTQLQERGRFVAYKPDEVTEEVMGVDDALDFAATNVVVYYAASGPLGWGISTQSEETAPLGLYGEDVLFLPTDELSRGFEIVDGVPEGIFEQVKQVRPELSQLSEQGFGAGRERADEQFRGLLDALDSAIRAGRTPITVEISPEADFYRYRSEEEYPYRNALDQWLVHLQEQYPDLVIGMDVVPDLEEPFLIPALVAPETSEAAREVQLLPSSEEVFFTELIRTAQEEPPEVDITSYYMAYTDITGEVPKSLTDLQIAIIDNPSLATEIATWISKQQRQELTADDVLDALEVGDYVALPPTPELYEGVEPIPEPYPEIVPPEPFKPLSEEEVQQEYNNLIDRLPTTLDFLAKQLAEDPSRREWSGLQVYVSPSLHGTMREELLEGIFDAAYTRGLPSPRDLGIDLLVKTPSQLAEEHLRTVPIFHFVETPQWEGVGWKEEFDPEVTERLMQDALAIAELLARDIPGGTLRFYIHPDLLQQFGEDNLNRVIQETLEPPFDRPERTTILLDENVPGEGFDVVPWRPELPTGPGRPLRPPREELPTPTPGPTREPADFPPEIAEEFLKTRQDYDVEMAAALEHAVLSLTTQKKLFSADASALLESGKRRSLMVPDELRSLFFDQGIDVARGTTIRPFGARDLMITGEEQSYFLKVSPEGWMDVYALSSDYRDADAIDDLEDGVNAAASFLETYRSRPEEDPDVHITDVQDYWETKIQPNKPDSFCTGWATVMQLYGLPLTRTINVGDPDKPEIQRSNGRADAISLIQRLLTGPAEAVDSTVVADHLETVIRGGGLNVQHPYIQGWFEGLGQEGFPPSLLGYPGVLQEEAPPVTPEAPEAPEEVPEEIPEELWNFRQTFIEQARTMGYSDEEILAAVGDPEHLQETYDLYAQQERTSHKLPLTEEVFFTELIRTAQEEPPEVGQSAEELGGFIEQILGRPPEEPPPVPELPPEKPSIEVPEPEEVPPEVEDEYTKIVSTLRGVDQESMIGIYIGASLILYEFIGGTPGIQQDLIDEGWDEGVAGRVFLTLDADLGPDIGLLSTMSVTTSPAYEEITLLPQPGYREKESGQIWGGDKWFIPEEQVYELGGMRFKLLNEEPFGTRELWFPVEITWASRESGTESGKKHSIPLSWLQAAEAVDRPIPTEEELMGRVWERGTESLGYLQREFVRV